MPFEVVLDEPELRAGNLVQVVIGLTPGGRYETLALGSFPAEHFDTVELRLWSGKRILISLVEREVVVESLESGDLIWQGGEEAVEVAIR